MKICDKVKFSSNIVQSAFIFSKVFLFLPTLFLAVRYHFHDLHYHLLVPALSTPGTCIIISKDLHFHFKDLHYHFQGSALSLPGTCIIASEDLHFLFRDLHYCFRDLHYHFQDLHNCFRTCIILP